jgi:hypothetical protein
MNYGHHTIHLHSSISVHRRCPTILDGHSPTTFGQAELLLLIGNWIAVEMVRQKPELLQKCIYGEQRQHNFSGHSENNPKKKRTISLGPPQRPQASTTPRARIRKDQEITESWAPTSCEVCLISRQEMNRPAPSLRFGIGDHGNATRAQ